VTAPGRPHFDSPPVTEVRLSVSYDSLPRMRAAHAGLLWRQLDGVNRFPDIEELYPDPAQDEIFGPSRERPPLDISVFDRPPPTRSAFRSASRTESVEVQDDQLTVLWTEQPRGGDYPRYEHVRRSFVTAWDAWSRVVEEQRVGVLRLRQAEISYVNHLPIGGGWESVADLADVLRLQWMPSLSDRQTEAPEDLHLYQRYVLKRHEEPYGRLYVSVDSASEWNGKKAVGLSLTVRSRPAEGTVRATLDVLDEGHDLIVSSFVAVTTERMHAYWGRRTS
jgi:uncharacterized protein (TIGR04255 family)